MSRRTRKNIGLVGLGLIGNRIREVLRRKGFQVFVWNRTPRPVPNFVGAPSELAEMCDFVHVFVSDDDALMFVVKQLSPALSGRHIVIAHPTVAPQTMSAAAQIVERRGARFLEAPFTGSKEAAEKGELVYYVGGEEAVIRDARPLLAASSKEILEFGEVGQATAIKVATNIITAATVQAGAEALALIQAAGLSADKFLHAMQQNASYSKTLAMKLPKMIDHDFVRHFSVQHMLKDMQIASRLGLTHHLELGVTVAARDRLLEQMQRGHGEDDYSAVARKYYPTPKPGAAETELELFQSQTTPAPAEKSRQPDAGIETAAKEQSLEKKAPEAERKTEELASEARGRREPAEGVTSPAVAEQKSDSAQSSEPDVGDKAAAVVGANGGPGLKALEAQVPAAPFLNPVEPSASGHVDQGVANVAVESGREFVTQHDDTLGDEESREARGFFSRLLRRANS